MPDLVDAELLLEEQRLRRSIVSKVFGLAYGTLGLGALDMMLRSVVSGYASPEWLPWLIGSGLIGAIVGFFTSTRFADWLFRRRDSQPDPLGRPDTRQLPPP